MNLVIISLNPTDEIFLSKEIKYLKERFDVIFMFRNRGKYKNITIEPDERIKTIPIEDPRSSKIIWAINLLLSLFKPEVWKEICNITKMGKASILSLKRILFYSASSSIDGKKILNILRNNDISTQSEMIFYAYRMNTSALSILKVQKKHQGAKCIARAHSVDLYEYRQKGNYLPFRKKILRGLAAVYCISDDGMKYVNKYPFSHCRVEVSRLGTQDCGLEINNNHKCRKPLFISCSRVSPEKRIEKLVDALALINEELQWIHIGGGDSLEELKKYAKDKLEDKDNIFYELVGNKSNEYVTSYYKEHFVDGFINVSSVEGIPVSIMEAISFGIPIIATDVGGTGEIVKDGFNGFLIPSDFSDELLSSKIIAIVNNTSITKHFRKNARSEWEANYNEEMNYHMFAEEIMCL